MSSSSHTDGWRRSAPECSSREKHPSQASWEKHKAKIINLYHPKSKMTLREIVEHMGTTNEFWATEAMYKTRLKRWKASRNAKKHRKQPTPSHPIVTPQEEIPVSVSDALYTMSKSHCHENFEVWQTVEALPTVVRKYASSPEFLRSSQSEVSTQCWMSNAPIRNAEWLRRGGSSSSSSKDMSVKKLKGTHIITPDGSVSSEDFTRTRSDSNEDWEGEFSRIHCDFRTAIMNAMAQYDQPWADQKSLPEKQALSHTGLTLEVFADRPHNLSTSSRDIDQYPSSQLRSSSSNASGDYSSLPQAYHTPRLLATRAEPRTFADVCYEFSFLKSKKSDDHGEHIAAQAFHTYSQLVKEKHKHALTCLNTVMITLLMYNKDMEAGELISKARWAAMAQLDADHPHVQVIDYIMCQANGQFHLIESDRLYTAYNSFCNTLSPRHPHSLVAGYVLAWRLSAGRVSNQHFLEALQLLDRLQTDSNKTLGSTHKQSIAMLLTKVRVFHKWKLYSDALRVMDEAMSRIHFAYAPQHPYLLKARSWYAELLHYADRNDEAEVEWVAAALGRVEFHGRGHPLSIETIQKVELFFSETNRQSHGEGFRTQLVDAEDRYHRQNLELVCLSDD